jgi:hypothetical protein
MTRDDLPLLFAAADARAETKALAARGWSGAMRYDFEPNYEWREHQRMMREGPPAIGTFASRHWRNEQAPRPVARPPAPHSGYIEVGRQFMLGFVLLAIYIIAALVVAHFGHATRAGYLGTFLLSLLLSPIVTGLMLAAFREREPTVPGTEPASP